MLTSIGIAPPRSALPVMANETALHALYMTTSGALHVAIWHAPAPADHADHERDVAATRVAMGHDSFEAARVAGGGLAPKTAIAAALAKTAVYGSYERK